MKIVLILWFLCFIIHVFIFLYDLFALDPSILKIGVSPYGIPVLILVLVLNPCNAASGLN